MSSLKIFNMNTYEVENGLWWKKHFLLLAKVSLKFYEETKEKRFYEFAKHFAKCAKEQGERGTASVKELLRQED